jgi:hypothetical protein
MGSIVTIALALFFGSVGAAPNAFAYISGDGRGNPASDCFIGLEGYDPIDQSFVGRSAKPVIQCTDGDECDLDGSVNGACRFSIAVAVNRGGVDGCTPRVLAKVKAKAKTAGTEIRFDTIFQPPLDGSSAVSGFVDFPVLVKKFGTAMAKPGKGVVSVLARRPKDQDRFGFVCKPGFRDGNPPTCITPRAGYAGRWRLDGAAAPGTCTEPTFPDELIISQWGIGGYEAEISRIDVVGHPDADGLALYGWAGAGHCATGGFDANVSVFIRGRPRDCPLDVEIWYSHAPLFGECPRCSERWTGTMTLVVGTPLAKPAGDLLR